MQTKRLLPFAFTLAILLRLLLVPNPGFEADVSFWKSWGLATYDKGIVEGIKLTNNNYPTPFAYTLGLMVKIYSIFKDPHNFNEFWTNTNLTFLAVSKAFPILADFGIAALILFIGRNASALGFPILSFSTYQLLALGYLFSPISLIDGALWGQVDSLGLFIFLSAIILALKRWPFLAGALFMVAMMTKLQNMIYGPLFFLFIWQLTGPAGLARAAAGAFAGFVGLNIEFFTSHNMNRVILSLTQNYDYFPYLSLNAFNLWWIVSGAKGMQVIDKVAAIGIVNAKTVGLLIFSSFYLLALVRQRTLKTFWENLIIINATFFLFMTESHDRYLFPTTVFLLLWAPSFKRFKVFTICYTLFTLLYFYNLHTALVFNYPNNGLPLLSQLIQPPVTIAVSVLLICLFVLFVGRSLLFPLLIFVLGLVFLNKPLWMKQPVSLTKFTPYISTQDFGSRQTNRSVNSSFGINSWNRLSVQYAFYQHGIGTHANSGHMYDINRKFIRFTTDYGIDTESGLKASAIFEIYGDNKLLFQSEPMKKFDFPRHAEINIQGIKHLTLVTTDAGDGNVDDHTDWLNPILWP